ncbi:hypothetical protein ABZX40_31610 [Streptomyces sp. NPDC004610]|uniref:hypothetical protein n=1 Tax=unclassified Streptomyces TaxID=2593676 RepID=UPI0033BD5811
MAPTAFRRVTTALAVGAAAVTALAVTTSGTAHAGAAGFYVSLRTHSNVRTAPNTQNTPVLNTGPTTDRYHLDGVCYVRGQRVTAGGYTTDVWYRGTVHDSVIGSGGPYRGVHVWGGNVNIGQDPSDSVGVCAN